MPTAASLAHADTNNLEPFFMPFTANRSFKADPRLIVGAEGVHYIARDGRRVFDASAGLWCVNAGHCRSPSSRRCSGRWRRWISRPPSRWGTRPPSSSRRASCRSLFRWTWTPFLHRQFRFRGGGHRPQDRRCLAPRARRGAAHPSHRCASAAITASASAAPRSGGIKNNRKAFGMLLPGVDHLRAHCSTGAGNAFQPGRARPRHPPAPT